MWKLWAHKIVRLVTWAKKKLIGQDFLPFWCNPTINYKVYYTEGGGGFSPSLGHNVSCEFDMNMKHFDFYLF
jgi:hypothetical protein